jgi:hypothetical protein
MLLYSLTQDFESYLLFSNAVAVNSATLAGNNTIRYNSSTNKLTVGTVSATKYLGGVVSGSAQLTELNTYTGSNDSVISAILQTTASLNTYTGSNDSVISRILQTTASLNSKTGSYATTGSNTFYGVQTITGSLFVSGSTNVDYIIFNSQSVAPLQNYMLQANTTDKTLDLRMGNNATLQLGQELYYPPIVNKSGASLPNGCLVMFNPADPTQGNRIAVVKCISDGTYPSEYIVGILTEDVAINQEGFATWFGYVRNVSRTELQNAGLKDPAETWAEGQILYPHPTRPGGLTNVQPTAPNLKSSICVITSINGVNITFLVRPQLRGTLKGLHDVKDTTTTSTYGDLLVKSGSAWINSKTLIGNYSVTGSLIVSASTNLTGSVTINESRIDNAWTSYTPTWEAPTPPAIGNGTITGAYKVIGKTCFVRGRITMGSTTTYGSGDWSIGLPVAAINAYAIQIPASLLDGSGGTGFYNALMNGAVALNTISSQILANFPPSFGGSTAGGISSLFPFTWGSGDALYFNGSYEIA